MFINKSKLFRTGLALAVVLSSGMISNTYAQDGAFAIEEITVTARKNIQVMKVKDLSMYPDIVSE